MVVTPPEHLDEAETTAGGSTEATNLVWRVRWSWRRPGRARTWASRTQVFVSKKPAVFWAQRLLGEGFGVELTTAHHGMWRPEDIPLATEVDIQIGSRCAACGGSGLILREIEEYCRPCPTCRLLAS